MKRVYVLKYPHIGEIAIPNTIENSLIIDRLRSIMDDTPTESLFADSPKELIDYIVSIYSEKTKALKRLQKAYHTESKNSTDAEGRQKIIGFSNICNENDANKDKETV